MIIIVACKNLLNCSEVMQVFKILQIQLQTIKSGACRLSFNYIVLFLNTFLNKCVFSNLLNILISEYTRLNYLLSSVINANLINYSIAPMTLP